MNEKQNQTGKLSRFFEEKGFYIILFLCIAAIGIAGYVLFIAPENTESASVSANIISPTETGKSGGAKTGQTPTGGYKAPSSAASSARDSVKPEDAEEASVSVIPSSESVKTEKKEEAVETVKNTGKDAKTQEKETAPRTESKPKQEAKAEAPKENRPAAAFFVKPVAGDVIRSFCVTELVYDRTMGDWRTHNGADYSAETGETVCAVADGTVKEIKADDFYGTTVVIEHDGGLESFYYGLAAEPTVKTGDSVKAGAVIGSIGKGYHFEALEPVHLHLEMKSAGKYVDPAEYIK